MFSYYMVVIIMKHCKYIRYNIIQLPFTDGAYVDFVRNLFIFNDIKDTPYASGY